MNVQSATIHVVGYICCGKHLVRQVSNSEHLINQIGNDAEENGACIARPGWLNASYSSF